MRSPIVSASGLAEAYCCPYGYGRKANAPEPVHPRSEPNKKAIKRLGRENLFDLMAVCRMRGDHFFELGGRIADGHARHIKKRWAWPSDKDHR